MYADDHTKKLADVEYFFEKARETDVQSEQVVLLKKAATCLDSIIRRVEDEMEASE